MIKLFDVEEEEKLNGIHSRLLISIFTQNATKLSKANLFNAG